MGILDRIIDSFKFLDKNGLKKVAALTEKVFRYKVMPAAEQRWEGKLVQYIGTTDATYTKGYFYICKEGETTGTYVWEQTNVQPNNDYVLWDGTHAQYEIEKDGIPADAYVNFTDDYDENVEVGVYATRETKTGEIFLNKPVYRKVFLTQIGTASAWTDSTFDTGIPAGTIDIVTNIKLLIKNDITNPSRPYWFSDGWAGSGGSTTSVQKLNVYVTEASVAGKTCLYWQMPAGSWPVGCKCFAIIEYTKKAD